MKQYTQNNHQSVHSEPVNQPVEAIVGPTGRPMTRADLPPANTKRWVMRRKAEVVAGVRAGRHHAAARLAW